MASADKSVFEKRATTRSIAEAAGVSSATVSMALRNHRLISAKTRQKVQRIAQKLGYRPDPEVAKLMYHLRLKHKPKFKSTIAALTSIPESGEPPYAAALRHGAQEAAEALGYGFSVVRLEASEERNTSVQRILRSRGVQGVLLLPMRKPVSLKDLLDWNSFSVVVATYGVLKPDFHRVVPDQFGNTLSICQELARLGARRIGLVIEAKQDLVVGHHFSAAVLWQNALGGTEHVAPLVYDGEFRAELAPWFARERPDAIITATTETDVRTMAETLGLDLPGPVEFALTERAGPTLLGCIDQRPGEIGKAAITLLHSKIQSGEKGAPKVPTATMIKGRWFGPTRPRHRGVSKAEVKSAKSKPVRR
jgi:DNA-binding LacI/PurR family transcriptional regulator